MQNGMRRSIGTVLMGIGLLLILSVGGYFAWTEVQAAQVRNELASSAEAAAARATRVANDVAQSTQVQDDPGGPLPTPVLAAAKAAARLAPTATRTAVAPARSSATRAPQPTAAATAVPSATDAPATAANTATVSPTATAAPVLPVRLAIPDLKIDTPVTEMGWDVVQTKSGPVSEWAIPENVAGHHLNSASIGQRDNLVISGHNNIYGRVFMPISQAWNNDKRVKVDNFTDRSDVLNGRELVLYDDAGNAYKYVITDFFRLKDTGVSQQQREKNGRFILPTGDERVTIITCWPPTNNTHRLVVIARPER
jgi:sortase A